MLFSIQITDDLRIPIFTVNSSRFETKSNLKLTGSGIKKRLSRPAPLRAAHKGSATLQVRLRIARLCFISALADVAFSPHGFAVRHSSPDFFAVCSPRDVPDKQNVFFVFIL